MRLLLIYLLLLYCNFSKAEGKLLMCTNYNEDGTYSGVYENVFINKEGNFMYLFYESSTPITDDTLYVNINKEFNRRDSNFYKFDYYHLVVDNSKMWAVNKYIFTKPGRYKISTFNKNGDEIAKPYYANVGYYESEYDDLLIKDSWYYSSSKLSFYEKNIEDSLIGENNIFNYQSPETKIILKIEQENNKPLNTSNLFAKIYSDDKNQEFISANSYYVNANWWWTYVPIYFKSKGKFIVELYTNNDIFIQRKKVEIK